VLEADALTAAASTHQRAGDSLSARECGEPALEIHTRTGNRLGQARTLKILGRVPEATKIFAELGIPEHRR